MSRPTGLNQRLSGRNGQGNMATNLNQNQIDRPGENEPLLGNPGDATQPKDKNIAHNLIIGKCLSF